jgi:hypothetical protein
MPSYGISGPKVCVGRGSALPPAGCRRPKAAVQGASPPHTHTRPARRPPAAPPRRFWHWRWCLSRLRPPAHGLKGMPGRLLKCWIWWRQRCPILLIASGPGPVFERTAPARSAHPKARHHCTAAAVQPRRHRVSPPPHPFTPAAPPSTATSPGLGTSTTAPAATATSGPTRWAGGWAGGRVGLLHGRAAARRAEGSCLGRPRGLGGPFGLRGG